MPIDGLLYFFCTTGLYWVAHGPRGTLVYLAGGDVYGRIRDVVAVVTSGL